MKKYLIYLPIALAFLGIVSCSQDRDPKYRAPEAGSFKLNNPAMMDQEIILSDAGDATLEFSCSQPDYGFAASASYSVDMALNENFADFYSLSSLNENSAIISVLQSEVAAGYCELMGIDSEETYSEKYPDGFPVTKVYFRANCRIPGIDNSAITSNVVSYNYLKPYFAVAVPGSIYLIGNPGGWVEPAEGNAATLASWRLMEDDDAIGSKIYKGSFEIDAKYGDDGPIFRFYAALTGWDGGDSYGTQVDDNAIEFPEFTGDVFEHELVKGKGSFSFPNWPGGTMNMVVNMSDPNNMTVTFSGGDQEIFVAKYIYLMGSLQGWTPPSVNNESAYANYRLVNSADAENIYTGTFNAPAGKLQYRFVTQLDGEGDAGWDNPYQLAYQVDDNDTDFTFTNGVIETPFVHGKGNWAVELDADAKVTFVVDLDNETASCILEQE